jgi:hypothetical protein
LKRSPSDPTRPLILRLGLPSSPAVGRQVLKIKELTPDAGAKAAAVRPPLTALGEIMADLRGRWEMQSEH